jgi:hypothetical protein
MQFSANWRTIPLIWAASNTAGQLLGSTVATADGATDGATTGDGADAALGLGGADVAGAFRPTV